VAGLYFFRCTKKEGTRKRGLPHLRAPRRQGIVVSAFGKQHWAQPFRDRNFCTVGPGLGRMSGHGFVRGQGCVGLGAHKPGMPTTKTPLPLTMFPVIFVKPPSRVGQHRSSDMEKAARRRQKCQKMPRCSAAMFRQRDDRPVRGTRAAGDARLARATSSLRSFRISTAGAGTAYLYRAQTREPTPPANAPCGEEHRPKVLGE
jgi:hypothetical protein